MASPKPGSSAKIPAISFHHGNCFPLAVPSSASSFANPASKVATLCSSSTVATGIPLLGCELFLILPARILRINRMTKPSQRRHAGYSDWARRQASYLVCRGSFCRAIWISAKSTETATKAAVELKTKTQFSHRETAGGPDSALRPIARGLLRCMVAQLAANVADFRRPFGDRSILRVH
jgi:hypothetical protein